VLTWPLLQPYTFYDFIINKARGKSGPLFNFDVHDDVRLLADATKEKDESHAGKVVERSYYQKNKHIFPASRWEVGALCACYSLSGADTFARCLIQRKTMESTPLHDTSRAGLVTC
jgi:XAP5, circadian clock regulator